jgi:hypothetical protein
MNSRRLAVLTEFKQLELKLKLLQIFKPRNNFPQGCMALKISHRASFRDFVSKTVLSSRALMHERMAHLRSMHAYLTFNAC